MSKKKFTPWTYVLQVDENVVGAFTSVSLAYAHWIVYAEKYSTPDAPFAHCSRFRYCMDPYTSEQQDVTLMFARQWQVAREVKQKEIQQ